MAGCGGSREWLGKAEQESAYLSGGGLLQAGECLVIMRTAAGRGVLGRSGFICRSMQSEHEIFGRRLLKQSVLAQGMAYKQENACAR